MFRRGDVIFFTMQHTLYRGIVLDGTEEHYKLFPINAKVKKPVEIPKNRIHSTTPIEELNKEEIEKIIAGGIK